MSVSRVAHLKRVRISAAIQGKRHAPRPSHLLVLLLAVRDTARSRANTAPEYLVLVPDIQHLGCVTPGKCLPPHACTVVTGVTTRDVINIIWCHHVGVKLWGHHVLRVHSMHDEKTNTPRQTKRDKFQNNEQRTKVTTIKYFAHALTQLDQAWQKEMSASFVSLP